MSLTEVRSGNKFRKCMTSDPQTGVKTTINSSIFLHGNSPWSSPWTSPQTTVQVCTQPYGIPERTKLSIKIHGQIVKNFHGQNVIISCSWCVQDFMVMVRFHFHAHGVCKISWSWSDSIFMLMVCARFHGHGQIPFSCSWSDSIP